ncbi:metalloregulator ArsR/SmtB family transcription factor [Desulfosporosinus sp. PR]|uniref:ArsR/SmtB family transcription factor n=1 Tax=Candidatus Desulfosporosinus nitrosoreducens TaxID=3401928 RepID=UPI0027F124C4|nr:metalloregulator ArsR/SmtB family transcription factor [Desulfosporosinus sp. PR]MDQ7094448.1 metalloregulator ArsR/SmtB family transcription factor [Desulfosporosinus sp. PR]
MVIEYSPFLEVVSSLHVLQEPKHHLERLTWALETEALLSPALKQQIADLGQASNDWLNLFDLHDICNFRETSVEEGIEKLLEVNERQFVYCLMGQVMSLEHIDLWLQGNEVEKEQWTKPQRDLLRKPATLRRQFADVLSAYYQEYFTKELRRIEPWLISSVHTFQEKLRQAPLEAMESIHPRFILREQEILFYKAHTWRFPYSELSRIIVQPSTFIAPHLLMGTFESTVSVGYALSVPGADRTDAVPQDLLGIMNAMSDESRMKILRQVFYHPYCTQQLAEMYNLAEATVSKHLKILSQAGLVRSERKGNYVFYSGDRKRIQQVPVDLNQFFDQPLLDKAHTGEEK